MSRSNPKIVVTPPSFCKSEKLKNELKQYFPNAVFNQIKEGYLSGKELIDFLADADAAIIGRDKVDAEVVSSLPKLKMISKYGVGLDSLDRDAINRARIKLGVTPGTNKRSVAELSIGFMIGLCHNMEAMELKMECGSEMEDVSLQEKRWAL